MSLENEDELKVLARIELLLAGLLALQADGRDSDALSSKTEVRLAEIGFDTRTISRILGKNYEAVRKTISRAKQNSRGESATE